MCGYLVDQQNANLGNRPDFPYSVFTKNTKGQLISKADWRAIDSPIKWTDKFV